MVFSNPLRIINEHISAVRATAILTIPILLMTVEKDPVSFLAILLDMKYGKFKISIFERCNITRYLI
tara:strand:+ start:376 stop:576 length:201 start_codon:yes stop_codon:yes gene_type:complete